MEERRRCCVGWWSEWNTNCCDIWLSSNNVSLSIFLWWSFDPYHDFSSDDHEQWLMHTSQSFELKLILQRVVFTETVEEKWTNVSWRLWKLTFCALAFRLSDSKKDDLNSIGRIWQWFGGISVEAASQFQVNVFELKIVLSFFFFS